MDIMTGFGPVVAGSSPAGRTSTMKYNKLVRDKIPEIIKNKGQEVIFHIANKEEYKVKLYEKLKEKIEEFLKEPNSEELADVLEVMRAICTDLGISFEELDKIRREKVKKRGGFDNKIILDES